mgnify:CR=1 FL=1
MYDDIITLNAAIDPTKTNIVTKATLPQVHGVREKGNYFNLFSSKYCKFGFVCVLSKQSL